MQVGWNTGWLLGGRERERKELSPSSYVSHEFFTRIHKEPGDPWHSLGVCGLLQMGSKCFGNRIQILAISKIHEPLQKVKAAARAPDVVLAKLPQGPQAGA